MMCSPKPSLWARAVLALAAIAGAAAPVIAQTPTATLAIRGVTADEQRDPHVAKILVDRHGDAVYFSRGPLPFRGPRAPQPPVGRDPAAWKHVGTYAFRKEALLEFAAAPRDGASSSGERVARSRSQPRARSQRRWACAATTSARVREGWVKGVGSRPWACTWTTGSGRAPSRPSGLEREGVDPSPAVGLARVLAGQCSERERWSEAVGNERM